jgi:hypothetical protein
MKECIKCNEIKDLTNFNNSNRKKDGLSNTCKECYNDYRKIIRKKYIEEKFTPPSEEFLNSNYKICRVCEDEKLLSLFTKDKSSPTGRGGECVSCKNRMTREHKRNNKEKIRNESREYKLKNKDKIKEYGKKRYLEKKEHIKRVAKNWRLGNKEKVKEIRRSYTKNNPDRFSLKNSLKRAKIKNSIHPELDRNIYKVFYNMKNRLEQCLGIKYNIDHILPTARGGYHHHLNLQVIPADINFKKNDNLEFIHPSLVHWTELPAFLLDRVPPQYLHLLQ